MELLEKISKIILPFYFTIALQVFPYFISGAGKVEGR